MEDHDRTHGVESLTMTRKQKWAEYRRILRVLYSTCWDCERPCSECQAWARAKAFGREPTNTLAVACAASYEAATEMQRRGTMILIGNAESHERSTHDG